MPARILVIDRNEAFATMLQDMLVAEGGYHVEVSYTGSTALQRLQESDFDLTIVDTDLDAGDMGYQEVIDQVRRARPTMRLMLIPLIGEELSAQARQFDIQGTLSKPFFADDLLPGIQEALTKKVNPPSAPPAPAQTPAPHQAPAPSAPVQISASSTPAPDVQAVLADLARETMADAILLLSTAEGEEGIAAEASTLGEERTLALAQKSIVAVRAAQQAARLLGLPDAPFEHNMFESDSLRLYAMALDKETLLVLVTPINTPLGTIRHNLRRASRHLAELALT